MTNEELAKQLNDELKNATPEEILQYFLPKHGNRIALASSLGLEDQVLTAMAVKIKKDARVFTIDTGRLFPECYQLIDRTNDKYDIKIEVYSP
ncbi:MAG: phosphoadenosine phosphosulfate reductase family protein, partial [Paludibacteraceae bacterium]|nr:phosphoadenosine phosphosulfate reductase family protein [Paludibacteraceae bacterium]